MSSLSAYIKSFSDNRPGSVFSFFFFFFFSLTFLSLQTKTFHANSVQADETAHNEPFHQDLHDLPFLILD